MKRAWFIFTILFAQFSSVAFAQNNAQQEINTALMESTFLIRGPSKEALHKIAFGTVFFIGKPSIDGDRTYYVLVTANHVLDAIAGKQATIRLREPTPDGLFRPFPYTFRIRDNGRNLYVSHPTADVAAMYFSMPIHDPFYIVGESFLATDERIQELELHPGDELIALGFPNGTASNDIGFPILRSGMLASYPLVPTSVTKNFKFDFMIFPGNSGGPVYFNYPVRTLGGRLKTGGMVGVIGLVSEQAFSPIPELSSEPLKLGIVVPATFIRETIDMLPTRD